MSGAARPVVVVDGSAVQRRFVRDAFAAGAEFGVVGEARTAADLPGLVARLRPVVVLLDLDLPDALAALEQVMADTPLPVLGRSAALPGDDLSAARSAGAVDVLVKPELERQALGGEPTPDLRDAGERLRAATRVAARVRVITHPRGRLRLPAGDRVPAPGAVRLVALGASTGGPTALLAVLSALPADLAAAVLVVQHMGQGFVPGLVAWLDSMLPVPVRVGATGERLLPGAVTVAPGAGNLLVQDDRLRVRCVPAPPGQHHVPGIDATFCSVAEVVGPAAVGVVLTGMGRDGAAGLRAMRDRGATTFGQDEATSAVYGMPAAAHAAGAVERQLPLQAIGPALRDLLAADRPPATAGRAR